MKKWQIKSFTVKLGDDLLDSYLYKGPCVAQITCVSQRIAPHSSAAHYCWICFVEGTPPKNIKDRSVSTTNYEENVETISSSVLFVNIQQRSIADYLAILNTNNAYVVDEDDDKIQIIGDTAIPYLEMESSEPTDYASNVDPGSPIKITFNMQIKPALNYDQIFLKAMTGKVLQPAVTVLISKTLNGNTLIINPAHGSLSRNTKHVLNIPGNSIESQDEGYINTHGYKLTFTTMV